jgi:hypothetical protein
MRYDGQYENKYDLPGGIAVLAARIYFRCTLCHHVLVLPVSHVALRSVATKQKIIFQHIKIHKNKNIESLHMSRI